MIRASSQLRTGHKEFVEVPSYSVKYLGISDGHIGILTRRVPLMGKTSPQVRPNPEKYNEQVVHTFSRPRALTAVRKQRVVDEEELWISKLNPGYRAVKNRFNVRPQFKSPVERTGVVGWKLTYPQQSKKRRIVQKVKLHQHPKQAPDLEQYCGEPYLKYLSEKTTINLPV